MINVVNTSTEYIFNEDVFANVLQLTIDLDELPHQLVDSNSVDGYYRDQIYFCAIGPGELDEVNARIIITIRFGINPGYDDAVRSLLGYKTSAFFQNDDVDNLKDRVIERENYEFLNKDVQFLANRLMLNFTP